MVIVMVVAFDRGETVIAKFVPVAFYGDQIGGIGLGEFVLYGSGYPGTHGAEAVAAMDNDIKLPLKGKSDQVSFNGVHSVLFFLLLVLF